MQFGPGIKIGSGFRGAIGTTLLGAGATLWHSTSERSPFAEIHMSAVTGPVEVDVYAIADSGLDPWPAVEEIALLDNDALLGVYSITSTGTRVRLNLGSGSHQLTVREGPNAYAYAGVRVSRVVAPTALSTIAQTAPARRVVILGDSIATGFLATNPTTESWPMLIRDAGVWATTNHSGGGWRLSTFASSAPNIAALIALLTPCFDGTISNALWVALGYNDASDQLGAATYQTYLANLVDAVHAALPGVQIICQSPITADTETFGSVTLTQYRTAVSTVCAARYPWAIEVNGATDITSAPLTDGVHPGTAGNASYAADVAALLPWDPLQETGVAGYLGTLTDIYGARNLSWDTAGALIASDGAYNGQPTLDMSGSAYAHTASFAQAQPSTVVIVGNTDGGADAAFSDDASAFRLVSAYSGLGVYDGSGWLVGAGSAADFAAKSMVIAVHNGASSATYKNSSTAHASGNPGSNGIANGLLLGKRHDQTHFCNGKIAAHVEFTGAADAAKAAKIATWAAFRFGATWQ